MYKLICIILLTVSINVKGNDLVLEYLKHHPSIIYKDIAYAQFSHETAHFTSKLFMQGNNIGGIKFKGSRLSIGKLGTYAVYASWMHSIDEYARIQARLIKVTHTLSREDYFNKVLPKYAEDKAYTKLIKKLCKLYKKHTKS